MAGDKGKQPQKRPRSERLQITKSPVTQHLIMTERLQNMPLTPLTIPDFGNIAFPIYMQVVGNLKRRMISSTYGQNGQRIFDPLVRNSFELSAQEFKIENPNWVNYLNEMVLPKVAEGLKVDYCHLEAKLDKFLFYEKGSFFEKHVDTVKEVGSVGTLIIQLPSKYSGGQFVATIDGSTRVIDHSSSVTGNEFSGFYIAFSLGVEHSVKVVTEGYRSCLLFDLIDTSKGKVKASQTIDSEDEPEEIPQKRKSRAHKSVLSS